MSFFWVGLSVHAKDSAGPAAQLKGGDIQRFIQTMPQVIKDLKQMGASYDNIQDPASIQALMTSKKAQAVLQKYNWEQAEFTRKLTAIVAGYALVRMETELASLPEDQRAMVKAMMSGQMAHMFAVHDSDLARVKKHAAALKKFFDAQ
ncbi:hypothetical protein N9023_05490 [Opitutaceae bacterium]|nr:hypothetical protein [Opitutaceae bacterium]MDB4474442.1 hypothetical protein [Opitutaceae bacterium]